MSYCTKMTWDIASDRRVTRIVLEWHESLKRKGLRVNANKTKIEEEKIYPTNEI